MRVAVVDERQHCASGARRFWGNELGETLNATWRQRFAKPASAKLFLWAAMRDD